MSYTPFSSVYEAVDELKESITDISFRAGIIGISVFTAPFDIFGAHFPYLNNRVPSKTQNRVIREVLTQIYVYDENWQTGSNLDHKRRIVRERQKDSLSRLEEAVRSREDNFWAQLGKDYHSLMMRTCRESLRRGLDSDEFMKRTLMPIGEHIEDGIQEFYRTWGINREMKSNDSRQIRHEYMYLNHVMKEAFRRGMTNG